MFDKLKQKYINKGYENGYTEGKNFGYEACKVLEYKKGYNAGLAWAVEYYEGTKHDQCIKQEIDKVKNKSIKQQTNTDIVRDLENTMTLANALYEICDSDYFRIFLFETVKIKDIKEMIDYLNYLSMSEEIQKTYPITSDCLPELIMSLQEVIEHKLMLEEAEKILK